MLGVALEGTRFARPVKKTTSGFRVFHVKGRPLRFTRRLSRERGMSSVPLRNGSNLVLHATRPLKLSASTTSATSHMLTSTGLPEMTPIGTPVPEGYSKIRTLKSKDLRPKGRLIVVGDVHGCYNEFCQLMEECDYDKDTDHLIMAGDLVNKGPDSLKMLKKAMKLKAVVVRGNHEDNTLAAYYAHARGEEIAEKYEWVKEMKRKHVAFLENLPFVVKIPSHKLLIVHAGLVPGTDIEKQDMFAMYKMRDLRKCVIRDSWIPLERSITESIPWASEWNGPEHVIFGHDSSRRLQFHPFATGIDTGAVQGDQLSACVFPPEKKIPHPDGPATRENLGMQLVSIRVDGSQKLLFPTSPEKLSNILVSSTTKTYNEWLDMYQSYHEKTDLATV